MRSLCLIAALALLMAAGLAQAQPDLSRVTGPTLADTGSRWYVFHTLRLVSADGQRRYRIRVAVPRTDAPAGGFPALYLLDGNAALMELDDARLQRVVAAGHPPVLVFIATDNDLRIDAGARAYDDTPEPEGGDGQVLGRRSGGADAFLDLITGPIRTQVQALVPLDPARQTLWGHSYGGLFVLHALFSRPQAFSRYVAVDPSLWWNAGQILHAQRAWQARVGARDVAASLLLITGQGAGGKAETPLPTPDRQRAAAMRQARSAVPADAAARMADQLRTVCGLAVRHQVLPGLSHGQTLGASLPAAMQAAGRP